MDALLEMVPDVSVLLRHFCDEAGQAANSIYFCFLFVKKSLICLEEQIVDP